MNEVSDAVTFSVFSKIITALAGLFAVIVGYTKLADWAERRNAKAVTAIVKESMETHCPYTHAALHKDIGEIKQRLEEGDERMKTMERKIDEYGNGESAHTKMLKRICDRLGVEHEG